jgi:CheY-like chemotaxis protein
MLVLADASYMQISLMLIPTAIPAVYVGLVSNHATSGRVMSEMPKPLQVYIVEDSPITQRLLASEIAAAGAEPVGCSADAQTAIGDVFALQPDLILIDIGLASGSGLDVLKALQDHSLVPAAIKVVLTNYAEVEYKNLSLRLGADQFFDKSFETPQAFALINTLATEGRRVCV